MPDERKTVYVNDKPISIFNWAEVQHCVNAYDSELYLKVQKGEAEIVDPQGNRIGWGGFPVDGWHIYVRLVDLNDKPDAGESDSGTEPGAEDVDHSPIM